MAQSIDERAAAMSDSDLIRAVTMDRDSWAEDVLAIFNAEAGRRGIVGERLASAVMLEQQQRAADLAGVRGWLLVFVIWIILNSVSAFPTGLFLLGDVRGAGAVALLACVTSIAIGAYGLFASVRLLQSARRADRHAAILMVLFILHGFLSLYLTSSLLAFVSRAIGPLIGLAYLRGSERVKFTYARQTRDDKEGTPEAEVQTAQARTDTKLGRPTHIPPT